MRKSWAVLAISFASCTGTPSTDFRVTHLTQETFSPRPETQEIETISGNPDRAYVEIATLQGWDAEDGADGRRLMAQMRKRTRELGGDAIIQLQLLQRGDTNSVLRVPVGGGAVATARIRSGAINAFGIVVRWKD